MCVEAWCCWLLLTELLPLDLYHCRINSTDSAATMAVNPPSRTNSQRHSCRSNRSGSYRQTGNTTRGAPHRQSFNKNRQLTPEAPPSTTEEGQQQAGGMVLWVVRLSASLGILGGAFLFSGVSVLTNSFGQSHRTAQGPGKTSGIVFLAIGCLSLVLSAGLGYYGCRKRKKKEEDDCSDSGRALNFTPALSTTADMFPWPSTPSHQNQPSGSPYITPTVNEPVLASANSGEHKPGAPYSTPAAGEPAFESTYLPPQEEPPPQPGPSSGAGALVRSAQRSRRANAPMLTKQRAVLSTDCFSAASSPVKQEPPVSVATMDTAAAATAVADAATSRSLDPSSALSPGS